MEQMISLEKIMYVRPKCVFGNDVYYPACGVSTKLANVMGTKQITQQGIDIAKKVFGYEVHLKTTLPDTI